MSNVATCHTYVIWVGLRGEPKEAVRMVYNTNAISSNIGNFQEKGIKKRFRTVRWSRKSYFLEVAASAAVPLFPEEAVPPAAAVSLAVPEAPLDFLVVLGDLSPPVAPLTGRSRGETNDVIGVLERICGATSGLGGDTSSEFSRFHNSSRSFSFFFSLCLSIL
jgi:hypothetical protein